MPAAACTGELAALTMQGQVSTHGNVLAGATALQSAGSLPAGSDDRQSVTAQHRLIFGVLGLQ